MIIVSNVKDEGILFVDGTVHISVQELMDKECKSYFSLKYGCKGLVGYIGEWTTREAADRAINEIIKAYHCGNRDVILQNW